jgi:RNA polymerase subunit RPABC4/transcription elongation factor Spt4
MIVCPVCEHPQASGTECEVCGKRFAPGALPPDVIAPMEGLEPTGVGGGRELDAGPVGTIAELEATLAPPVDAPEDRTPDMEATRAPPVDVDAPAIPDIERIQSELPGDAPTALPIAPVCRYCRTPAVPGERICSRCGMKLPVVDVALVPAGTEGIRVCSNCGSVTTRELCPACGNRLGSA